MFIQQVLINWILNPINKFAANLPQKARDFLFYFGGFGLVFHCILHGARVISYRYLIYFTISCFFMGLMILGSLGRKLLPVRFRPVVFIPWMCCGFLMFISGIINNVDYMPDAMLILVAFPILYICFANVDRENIFRKLILINKLSLATFITISFLFIQITRKKYPGFSVNVNTTSFFLTITTIFILIEIISEKKFSKKVLLDILLVGAANALNYYTNSRTGPLALICATTIVLIIWFATNTWRSNLIAIAKLGFIGATSVVMIFSLVYVFQLRNLLPLPYINIKEQTIYMDSRWEGKFPFSEQSNTDSPTTDNNPTTSTDNNTTATPDKTDPEFFGNEGFQAENEHKLNTDKSLDKFSTGRISVWKSYAKDLNFRGHSSTPKVYVDFLSKKDISSTHMTILQVAYESGILAGVAYLTFNIASGIVAIIFAIKHKKEKYTLLPLGITVAFGAISLLASNRVAFYNMNTLMYYLMLFPVITCTAKTKTK